MADTASTTPPGSAAATTTTPPEITSFPKNPLTTTFSRPTDCTGISKSLFLAMMDLSSTCLPSGFKSQSSAYFSPGIACPSGYVSACHDNTGVASQTTVTCCPTLNRDISLSCVDDRTLRSVWSTLFCTWIAPKAQTTLRMTLSTNGGVTSTERVEFVSPDGINAFGIRMVYQKTDMDKATTTATGTSRPGQTGSNPTDSAPTNTSLPESDGGLSTGAKAAIGVVVPCVVLAVLFGVLFWWRRKRRNNTNTKAQGGASSELYKYQPQHNTSELQGQPVQELQGSVVDPVELPASTSHPRES
ncbi:transmembrane alpha-helix domain-containing protein [Purpureocillium lavendulum]|uniref:Transmembrane alpha-helix domain-containing protein n=1 Tax=Purpureocillium lavendulum TaxID=1247861 RepID=A0AB34G6M5_9HYPO|nr:transmembrane alpha-helix domain-containing protein [Purpureocillium lavendulum]